jgi:GxxExxY protein
MNENPCSNKVIGAALQVHKKLGPGLLESVYEECLAYELTKIGLYFERQKAIPVVYGDIHLDCGFRLDFLVENTVIVEIKSVEQIIPIHLAQIITYLRLTKHKLGLLINFNVRWLRMGIKRVVLNL